MGKKGRRYVDVILPLKLQQELTYEVGEALADTPDASLAGLWVEVPLGRHSYKGIISRVRDAVPDLEQERIKPLIRTLALPAVSEADITFWMNLAAYYMCSVGEVFKAAYSAALVKLADVKSRPRKASRQGANEPLPELSPAQKEALGKIDAAFAASRPALLCGVTGSGKTEIYLHEASRMVDSGRSVLYLVPEIAISRQLQQRIEAVFGDRLLVFHSRQTAPQKKALIEQMAAGGPHIILGTRSALFLPFHRLGLIIVDEEHDASYKQQDPAPRYHARDAALLLAAFRRCKVLLGSATPSYESLYNVAAGKFIRVDLLEKYHDGPEPEVTVIDMREVRRLHDATGSFSRKLLRAIRETVDGGGQVMIFRSRRAYAPFVQCTECGYVPKCPSCQVSLSYHKYNNTLQCHLCGTRITFADECPECHGKIIPLGSGTEKIEEELKEYCPQWRVERFDADIAESPVREKEVLGRFASGETDILVGTQMLTKGFDFERLRLVAALQADSLFAVQDFRADERALQLLSQFRGRAGRRDHPGRMYIQTSQPDHPVIRQLLAGESGFRQAEDLDQRRLYGFPPFVRMILITVRDSTEGRLWRMCRDIEGVLGRIGVSYNGPLQPMADRIEGKMIRQFWLKMPRNGRLAAAKADLKEGIDSLTESYPFKAEIIIDVDPY